MPTRLALALVVSLAPLPAQDIGSVPLRGRVVGPSGEGVPAARVAVRSEFGEVLARGATDADGTFAIGRVPIRSLEVTATAEGKAVRPQWIWPAVHANAPLTLRMFDAATFEGRVVGAEGEPVAGAQLLVARRDFSALADWEATAVTDADGAFRIAGAPLGPLSVRVAAEGHGVLRQERSLPLRAAAAFVLPAGGPRRLSVRVHDPEGAMGRQRWSISNRRITFEDCARLASELLHNPIDNVRSSLCLLPGWHTNERDDHARPDH